MSWFEKIQKADEFWKKSFLFGVLFLLAVPLLVFLIYDMKAKVGQASNSKMFESLGKFNPLPKDNYIGEMIGGDNATTSRLAEMMAELEALESATTTMATTTEE